MTPTSVKLTRNVLLIEDHETTRITLSGVLERENCKVTSVASAGMGREKLRDEEFDVVITDLRLPDGDGMEILEETKRLSAGSPVIIITGHGSEETAVQAMKKGAFNYLSKPLDLNRLRAELEGALRWRQVQVENAQLHQELVTRRRGDSELIGISAPMQRIRDKIKQIGPTGATVLITGESGVGKEVVAGALQAASDRAGKPFVKVNVAALPRELLESELFGHERGAFTSAVRTRKGRFELSDGGTLFLDEIAECPPEVQVKLLRVLQEQEFERLGGSETIRTDVRMIFATNRELKTEMAAGRFRQDLYFRINVIQIPVPPLRERKDDIDILAPHFIKDFNVRENRNKKLTPELMEVLRAYNWPGNVRELRNAIEHAYLLSSGDELRPDALPEDILEKAGGPRIPSTYPVPFAGVPGKPAEANNDGQVLSVPLSMKMDDVEKQFILAVYAKAGKNKTLAAKMLGIGLKTLYRKLIKYGEMSQHEAPDVKDDEA